MAASLKSIKSILVVLVASLGIVACGGGGGGGDAGIGGVPRNATSTLCADLAGIEAVYWDFINGVPRGDLPNTAFTIPFGINPNQLTYTNSNTLLLGFTVPAGWTATDGTDVTGFAIPSTFAAANLLRDDARALWRYTINGQLLGGGFSAESLLASEINNAVNLFGNPAPQQAQCELTTGLQPGPIGNVSVAAKIVRAGDVTIMARVQVIFTTVGPFYNSFISVGFTPEYELLINDIFVPMITQLIPGGSSFDNESACNDGRDNDGDGSTDFPNDTDCDSPADDSESA